MHEKRLFHRRKTRHIHIYIFVSEVGIIGIHSVTTLTLTKVGKQQKRNLAELELIK